MWVLIPDKGVMSEWRWKDTVIDDGRERKAGMMDGITGQWTS